MISVIIPSYNAAPVICRAIDSVLAQTYSDYEIIVVDDGSTDNTAEIIKKYGDKVRYLYQNSAGAGVARNTGIAAAKREWIAFLDADDQWLPDKLRLQTELLARNPELQWCATNYTQTDGVRSAPSISPSAIKTVLAGRDYIENYFVEATKDRCRIWTTTVVVHNSVFSKIGGFDPQFLRGQDTDMWWRIAHLYPQIGYIAEPTAIAYFDLEISILNTRRLSTKSGRNARIMMKKHLKLANQCRDSEVFRMFAKKVMRSRLSTSICHGYKNESRIMIKEFRDFFPWYWCVGAYLLTAVPGLTKFAARSLAYLMYLVGLEKEVSRRWLYTKNTYKKT